MLTKPLGTGIITTAHKAGDCPPEALSAAVRTMTALNDAACRAMTSVGVSAATDVTGYGLAGHLLSMLDASGAAARIHIARLPALAGTRELLPPGSIRGGVFATWRLRVTGSGEETRPLGAWCATRRLVGGCLSRFRPPRLMNSPGNSKKKAPAPW